METAFSGKQTGHPPAIYGGGKGDTGAAGKNGTNGASIASIKLIQDANGAITGGVATLTDDTTIDITIETEMA